MIRPFPSEVPEEWSEFFDQLQWPDETTVDYTFHQFEQRMKKLKDCCFSDSELVYLCKIGLNTMPFVSTRSLISLYNYVFKHISNIDGMQITFALLKRLNKRSDSWVLTKLHFEVCLYQESVDRLINTPEAIALLKDEIESLPNRFDEYLKDYPINSEQ